MPPYQRPQKSLAYFKYSDNSTLISWDRTPGWKLKDICGFKRHVLRVLYHYQRGYLHSVTLYLYDLLVLHDPVLFDIKTVPLLALRYNEFTCGWLKHNRVRWFRSAPLALSLFLREPTISFQQFPHVFFLPFVPIKTTYFSFNVLQQLIAFRENGM